MSTDKRDREPSLLEALQNPEAYDLTTDDIARLKRLQFQFRGWDIPRGAGQNFHWKNQLLLNKTKDPIGHMANVTLILSNDEDWLLPSSRPLLAWNSFRNQIVFRGQAPWAAAYSGDNSSAWSDEDCDRLVTWLGLKYQIKATPAVCFSAARMVAQANRFHPIQQMLSQLPPWDGVMRLSRWLSAYLGAITRGDDPQYLAEVGTWALVSLIARVMEPGCKVDTMLIFEGLQGKGKSMLLEILAGVSEYLLVLNGVELGTKESLELLRGKWVVEMAELDSMNRTESNAAKAFITKGSDTYRPAYGREAKDYVRQCVFFGTTNRAVYLQDETGGRRYWPVLCTKLDLKGFKAARDQLLAEALFLWKAMAAGEIEKQWWPTTDAQLERCHKEQEARRVSDPWEELIAIYLAKYSPSEVTIAQLLTDALRIPEGRQSRSDSTRVGLVLQTLKWTISGRLHRTGPRIYTPEQPTKNGSRLDQKSPWDSND